MGPLPAQKGCSCHKNQIRAGLCSHTSSCRRCTKTPSRRASHWLPGTVERCSSTEEPLHPEASVHNHTLMRGYLPVACSSSTSQQKTDEYLILMKITDVGRKLIVEFDFDDHIYAKWCFTLVWDTEENILMHINECCC